MNNVTNQHLKSIAEKSYISPMTKYREYFERMLTNEKEAFDKFTKLHLKYSIDQDSLQQEFNMEGVKIVEIIREWENKLCSTSDKAGYGNYTTNLSEKFWAEVRKTFPLIDHVGVIVKKSDAETKLGSRNKFSMNENFVINKIKL